MNLELIEKNIYQAIDAMDDEKLEKYAHDLKFSILKADDFLEEYFALLLRLLNQQKFVEMKGAWNFFKILKNCRELLSDAQIKQFLPAFKIAYTAFDEINPDVVKESIHQAIALNDSTKLEKCILDLDNCFFGVDHFPEDIFKFLISL
ncbi:MAG: hypothetical protein ACRC8K_13525, partial [Waterburya sp.]